MIYALALVSNNQTTSGWILPFPDDESALKYAQEEWTNATLRWGAAEEWDLKLWRLEDSVAISVDVSEWQEELEEQRTDREKRKETDFKLAHIGTLLRERPELAQKVVEFTNTEFQKK